MKNSALFYVTIAIAVIGIALGILYFMPHVYHPLTNVNSHHKLAAAFFVLAIAGIAAAFLTRPKKSLAK